MDAADQAVFQNGLVDRLLVVEEAAVVERITIFIADLIGQGDAKEVAVKGEAAGAAEAVDQCALVEFIGDAHAADGPGGDAPGEAFAVIEQNIDGKAGVEAGDVDVCAFGVAIFERNRVDQADVIGESPALGKVEGVEVPVDDVGVEIAVGKVSAEGIVVQHVEGFETQLEFGALADGKTLVE